MNNEPRATIYFYSGSESVELQLKDLDVKQLQHIVELSDLAGAQALNALSWAALEHRRTFPKEAGQ